MRKTMLWVGIAVLCLLVMNPQLSLAQEKTIKIKYAHMGTPRPLEDTIHGAAVAFKYVMEKRSGGRFQVEIYPSGTLGKEIDLLEAVKNNVVQVHAASMAGPHRGFSPTHGPEQWLCPLSKGPYLQPSDLQGKEPILKPGIRVIENVLHQFHDFPGNRPWRFEGPVLKTTYRQDLNARMAHKNLVCCEKRFR